MYNIRTPREDRRKLRLTWFVTASARPELGSRWVLEGLPLIGDETGASRGAIRNQPVTEACETETIAECA